MKTYFWKIRLCHLQHIIRIGQKYIPSFFIQSHKLMFPFFKSFERICIVTFYPASLI